MMSAIILIMHRKAITKSLMNRLQSNSKLQQIYEYDYGEVNKITKSYDANVALIEVAESGDYDIAYCLSLCKLLRKYVPECKLLLMCSEVDEQTIKLVINAKLWEKIDDFVFYDVTIDYLVSKLMSI